MAGVKRDKNGHFLKGTARLPGAGFARGRSGNPAGLPESVRQIRAMALTRAPEALARLVELMQQDEDRAVAVRASEALLDRAGIRPYSEEPEKIEVTGDGTDAIGRFAALLTRRLAAAGASGGGAGSNGGTLPSGS